MKCKICESTKSTVVYDGEIRGSSKKTLVRECSNCGVQWLAEVGSYCYSTGGYREEVGGDEIARHIPNIAHVCPVQSSIMGKRVLDVGASDGFYMKLVAPYAKQVVGVEPNHTQRSLLESEFTMEESLGNVQGQFDTITCWHVIEHIADPVNFLAEIAELLNPSGRLYISTPNRDEILMRLLQNEFAEFFFIQLITIRIKLLLRI